MTIVPAGCCAPSLPRPSSPGLRTSTRSLGFNSPMSAVPHDRPTLRRALLAGAPRLRGQSGLPDRPGRAGRAAAPVAGPAGAGAAGRLLAAGRRVRSLAPSPFAACASVCEAASRPRWCSAAGTAARAHGAGRMRHRDLGTGAVAVPDVVLVPCVGFTREGFRLGYGGGYFDRWLADASGRDGHRPGLVGRRRRISPVEAHDRALDA